MAAPPLPGVTYRTADFAFHSSPEVDLEAVDSYGPSEKDPSTLESRIHLPIQTSHDKARTRRGPPVLLILLSLSLCCLAFVVIVFMGSTPDDDLLLELSCVPERHATLAQQISAESRNAPRAEQVYVTQERALDILKQKYNTSRVGCHVANMRDYMRRSYPVVGSSLNWTNVSQSAIVLRWEGADPKLKPIVITNEAGMSSGRSSPWFQVGTSTPTSEVLGPEHEPARIFQCGDEGKAIEDKADVQSAVGLLTAVDALVKSGYQPSRTLVFGVMLGEVADLQKLSQSLYPAYSEHGVDMDRGPPPPPWCISGRLPKMWDALLAFYDRLYWRVSSLFPAKPHCIPADYEGPLAFRHVHHTKDDSGSRKMFAHTISVWAHIILEAGR